MCVCVCVCVCVCACVCACARACVCVIEWGEGKEEDKVSELSRQLMTTYSEFLV